MSNFRGVEGPAKERQRFVVSLERDWEWVAVLAAVGEGEAGWILEATRCAVDDFGDQGKRLQGARTQSFHQKQGGEIAKLLIMRKREHRA